jgi:hypothetical protein
MAWIPLDSDDVLNSLSDAEQSQFAAAPSAQADLSNLVVTVTNQVRGKVNAARRNQGHLGPTGTIPDELQAAALSIIRYKLLTHLPGTQLITEDRRTDHRDALGLLDAVARGEMVVVRGDETVTPPVGSDYGGEDYFKPYSDSSSRYIGNPW